MKNIGAPAHTAKSVITYLKEVFGDRVISKNATIKWPPKSPDLAPNDYSYWGRLQDYVYHKKVKNIEELKQAVFDFNELLSEEDVRKMVQSIRRRAQLCLDCDGDTFEHLVKKKSVQDHGDGDDSSSSSDDSSSDEDDDEESEDLDDDEEENEDLEDDDDKEITSSISIASITSSITSSIKIAAADDDDDVNEDTIEENNDLDKNDDDDEDFGIRRRRIYQNYGLQPVASTSSGKKGRGNMNASAAGRLTENAKKAPAKSIRSFLADYSDSDSD